MHYIWTIAEHLLSVIGGIGLLLTLLGFLFRTTVTNLIATYFNKSIQKYRSELTRTNDEYRNELNIHLESFKQRQQRAFKEFESYSSKKNDKYPELFRLVETALGGIMRLQGDGRYLTFENVDEEDVEQFMDSKGMTHKDKNEVLGLWSQNKDEAINKLNKMIERIDYNGAYEKWHEANDYLIFNILFLTEDVTNQCRSLLDDIFEYLGWFEPLFPLSRENISRINSLRDDIIPSKRDSLRIAMKKELTTTFAQDE